VYTCGCNNDHMQWLILEAYLLHDGPDHDNLLPGQWLDEQH